VAVARLWENYVYHQSVDVAVDAAVVERKYGNDADTRKERCLHSARSPHAFSLLRPRRLLFRSARQSRAFFSPRFPHANPNVPALCVVSYLFQQLLFSSPNPSIAPYPMSSWHLLSLSIFRSRATAQTRPSRRFLWPSSSSSYSSSFPSSSAPYDTPPSDSSTTSSNADVPS